MLKNSRNHLTSSCISSYSCNYTKHGHQTIKTFSTRVHCFKNIKLNKKLAVREWNTVRVCLKWTLAVKTRRHIIGTDQQKTLENEKNRENFHVSHHANNTIVLQVWRLASSGLYKNLGSLCIAQHQEFKLIVNKTKYFYTVNGILCFMVNIHISQGHMHPNMSLRFISLLRWININK